MPEAVTVKEAARLVAKAKREALEDKLAGQLAALGIHPERQWRFHPTRLWRFDFAMPAHMVAVEVDGGTWNGGRHVRGSGYRKDTEKMNAAQALGWTVLRYTTDTVRSGAAAREIAEIVEGRR
jgi:very-short-patch-repair endonuclease